MSRVEADRTSVELLPSGVFLRRLELQVDPRGGFAELFREQWETGVRPLQWSLVLSAPDTMRGVHVHVVHDDYLIVLQGRMKLGLRDLRRGSPTEGRSVVVELAGNDLRAITIPHGVAHGLFFPEQTLCLLAVSEYWNTADELGCRWDDPGLELTWAVDDPTLSPRDAMAGTLADLLEQLEPSQPL